MKKKLPPLLFYCNKNRLFIVLPLLLFFPPAYASAFPEKGDSLSRQDQEYSRSLASAKLSFKLDKMTDQELVNLVDSFFDSNSFSDNLIKDINLEIEKRKKIKEADAIASAPYPAHHYYKSWDNIHIAPYSNSLSKTDTAVILALGDEDNNFVMPISGKITSNFGWRDSCYHNGVDIDLITGDKVRAAFSGMVRIAKRHRGYGKLVIIRHYNGLETYYAHLSKIKVKSGDKINAGDVIGLGGSTGKSTGSHLHFETRFKGKAINPKQIISFKENKLLADSLILRKTAWSYMAFPYGAKFYRIQRGDTLYEIAERFGTTTRNLANMNYISRKKVLKVGEYLRVG